MAELPRMHADSSDLNAGPLLEGFGATASPPEGGPMVSTEPSSHDRSGMTPLAHLLPTSYASWYGSS